MPVPTLVTDLSTTLASNSPAGSDNVFPDLDNYLRAMSGFIASIRDNTGNGWVSPYLPLTYSAGTANGVVYLNGSKVVTTGSALTFDGTNAATTGTSSATKFIPTGGTATGNGMYLPAANTLGWSTNGAKQLELDSSGNLGLGVTPSAWSSWKAVQVNGGSLANISSIITAVGGNWYADAVGDKYYANGTACRLDVNNSGGFQFKIAPSGTAGNAISFGDPKMTITSGGLVGIGTDPSYILHVAGGASAATRRVQIDNNSATSSNLTLLTLNRTSNASMPAQLVGQLQFNRTLTDSTVETAGSITVAGDNTAGSSVGNMTLAAVTQFIYQIGTEKARLTSAANFKIGGTNTRATTEGTNQLVLFNGTAPAGTLTNGVSIYSSSGEAYVMDAAGNATLFSPHDKETNEWIFKSKHTPTGKVLRIDVEKLLRFVNDHFGLDAVQEFMETP